jgi:hypothetical protein
MFQFAKRDLHLTWALGVAIFVILAWGSLWNRTLVPYGKEDPADISAHGQFGDAFGSINSLFSGLALIGLVYTVVLQREQTSAQQRQLIDQQMEASRQAREQFLTARLNARTAAVQVDKARHAVVAQARGGEALASTFLNRLNRAAMHIEILTLEANLGFEGGSWTTAVEKESIRQYLVKTLLFIPASFDQLPNKTDVQAASDLLLEGYQLSQQLAQAFREQYPDISGYAKNLSALFEKHKKDPMPAVEWCRSAENNLRRGEAPWV